MRAIDLQGRRVVFKGQEGRVIEVSDRTGEATIALSAPLGRPAPMVRVPDSEWDQLDVLED